MYTNWEQSDDLSGCVVPDPKADGSAPDPVNSECTLGALPAFIVQATSTQDVVEGVKFAAQYNLRLRIKNVGSIGAINFLPDTNWLN